MGTEVSLRKIDLHTIVFSPELQAWRRISLGTIQHPGMPIRKYLAGALTLTADERAKMVAKVDELRAISEADDNQENRKSRLGVVGNMLMAYPTAGGSEESGRARAGAYLAALDDVPPWSIAEAVRRWHRGECGADHNYRFAPSPAELRHAAMEILKPAKQTIAHLESILGALPIERAMDPAPIELPAKRPMLRAL